MSRTATLLALLTVALWSFLGTLGAQVNHLPSILVVGAALTLSGLLSAVRWRDWLVPLRTLAVGVGGIFGYHFLYFSALRYAPVVEANLMNYLWPLLIVLLSPVFLPGHALKGHHLLGSGLGLLGAGLIVTGGRLALDMANLPGYLMAGSAAFIWACYSLLSKRLPPFPTGAVGSFCLVSGLISLAVVLLDPSGGWQLPSARDALFLALLGLGPLGTAFFTWDAALKRGDPRVIGSLAYITPLTSTLLLVALAGKPFTWVSAAAMVLIVSGAALGSLDLWSRPSRQWNQIH